jgi:hypothetical protein
MFPRERSIGGLAEAMAKPRRDSKREDRIRNEVLVDTYNPEEQVMGWYYYLRQTEISFPGEVRHFHRRATAQKGRNRRSFSHGS